MASLKISRILHAGYLLECPSFQIIFDPIFENPFSRNCYAFPNVEFDHDQIRRLRPAAVFISHYHDDHCSLDSLNLFDRGTPIYIYCHFPEMITMIRELGFRRVESLTVDQVVTIGPFEVIPRRALDDEVDSIFHIRAADLNILNVVDSWIDPRAFDELQKFSWDLVLWPFQTMREIEVLSPRRAPAAVHRLPPEWIEQLQLLRPRFVVPSSCQFIHERWSWYNRALFPISYRQFQLEVEGALPSTRVLRLDPSVSVTITSESCQESSPLAWIKPIGPQDLDYEFDENTPPPKTVEIAAHFAPLSQAERQTVEQYCTQGIFEKWKSLEPSLEPFFAQARIWRLNVVFDPTEVRSFSYRIENNQLERIPETDQGLAWVTEVCAKKLHAAVAQGESLTSMYLRVNDCAFPAELENEIAAADVLEDPLIRCLFNGGVFGAYQQNQLDRLRQTVPQLSNIPVV